MEIKNIKTYNNAPEKVFEILCSQLFENWLRREFDDIKHFSVVNGAGGDGGVEAYAIREDKSIIGLQAKWFTTSITATQINQIKNSITTAKEVRPDLKTYVVCIPRDTHSNKKGRNKDINSNTEESRLTQLKEDIKGLFEDLDVIFWKETRLITELKYPENDGLIRLWFEKEELSFETLRTRFDLAKAGWLSDRYFPDLHNKGIISEVIEETLITEKYLKEKQVSLQKQIDNLYEVIKLIRYYILKNKLDETLNLDLKNIKDNLEEFLNAFNSVKSYLKINRFPVQISIEEVKLFPILTKLEQTSVPNILKETHRRLKDLLFQLHQVDLNQYLSHMRQFLQPHNYVILGEPGTGKTHGVAYEVENSLKNKNPSLLIRAKDCEKLTWKNIFTDTLGCCSDWSDTEILSAFSSLAKEKSTCKARKQQNKFLNCNTKFLICVDGIDESPNPEKWIDLINETKVWLKKYPDIRFIFTCRSYPPSNQNPFSLPHDDQKIYRKDIYRYDNYLVFDYLKHFEINYDNTPWIINSFENNLSIRLFCEEYQGKDLSKEFKNPVYHSLRTLLDHKINRLDQEFNRKLDKLNPVYEKYVKVSLGYIAKLFSQNNSIEKQILRSKLYGYLDEVLNKKEINILLNLLTDSGFLIFFSQTTQDYGKDYEYYEIGIQSYFDYLISNEKAKIILENKLINTPSELLDVKYEYIRTLTGLALLCDGEVLVGQNGIWSSDFSKWELLKLQFDVLSLVPKEILQKYESFLTEVFLNDRDRFVKHFALPNSSRTDYNVIYNVIHTTLLKFTSTYERDLFWSGPDNHDINGNSHLSFCFEYRSISFFSKHDQEPLLYAWALSTSSRSIFEKIKSNLTQWALRDLEEFVKLLNVIFWNCGDGQVQEGLAAVIYGLASLINNDTSGSLELVRWIQDEIFGPQQISQIKNSVIRHSCRCFIEKSYKLGLCNIETYRSSIPPYKYNSKELLPFEIKGIIGYSGIYPIEHDLYWNKINDAYNSFIEYEDRILCKDIDDLIKLHNCGKMNPNEFFTRVALQILKELGWNKKEGYGDVGSSEFLTFEEKYTALAIHHIQGFLADRIKYKESGNSLLNDYGLLLHIKNPAHQESIKIEYLNNKSVKWFIPEDMSPILITKDETIKEDIKQWVENDNEYDFKIWIFPKNLRLLRDENLTKDQWIILDSYIALSDPNNIGRTWLDINCVLLNNANYSLLQKLLEKDNFELKIDENSIKAGIKGYVYNSLADVIWRDNILEYNQEIMPINFDNKYIPAYASVTNITERSPNNYDNTFDIPSTKLREILGINSTDKTSFYNNNKLIVINHSAHENMFNNQKMLLSDKEETLKALELNNLFPIWICTEFRSTMDTPILNRNNAHWQNCRKWICIGTEQNLKSYLIHNDYYK